MARISAELYLPQLLKEQLRDAPGAGTAACAVPVTGAMMFADIAGFSRLTERYAELGLEGAEQLARALNQYFGAQTGLIARYGGDTIDIIGDAIFALWRVGPEINLDTALRNATGCGLAMQALMPGINAQLEEDLRQRISIGVGDLRAYQVVGAGGMRGFVVSGAASQQVALANQDAGQGEVLVCAPWAQRLGESASLRPAPNGNSLVDRLSPDSPPDDSGSATAVDESNALPYLPAPLRKHLGEGARRRIAEFRHIVVVFVRLSGVDATQEDLLSPLDSAVQIVLRSLHTHAGSLERLSSDEKGLSLKCAFGVPYHSYEDNEVRGLRVALEVHETLRAAGIKVAIGVTRGRVFYSDTGGSARRYMCMTGAPINLAARLMTSIDDGVLCDEACREIAAENYSFEAAGSFSLKGFAHPVAVYRPIATRSRDTLRFDDALVDRVEERAVLEQHLQALRHGEGGTAVISGEAGVGKSRLLAYLIRRANQQDMRLLACNGAAIESATPYFPWRRLLSELLTGMAQAEPRRLRAELDRRLKSEPRLHAWIALLNDVLPMGIEEDAETAQMYGHGRAAGVQAIVLHLLRDALGTRRTVLIVDDLHWFDEASADLLDRFLSEAKDKKLLCLIASRPPAEAAPRAAEILRDVQDSTVPLGTLPTSFMAEFSALKLGVDRVPAPVVDLVTGRADGHALYSEELLTAIVEGGLVRIENRQCALSESFASSALLALPRTLEGVIVSRLDRLAPSTRNFLSAAAVIGRDFSTRQISVLIKDDLSLPRVLNDARTNQFIVELEAELPTDFSFRHAVIRDVIYSLMPFAERRLAHRTLASWMLDQAESDQGAPAAELALHWEGAGDYRQAIDSLEKAAEFATRQFSNREAVGHLQRANRLTEEHSLPVEPRRKRVWDRMAGFAQMELFETDDAARYFIRALGGTPWPVPSTGLGYFLCLLRECAVQALLRIGWIQPEAEKEQTARTQEMKDAALMHEQLQAAYTYKADAIRGVYHQFVAMNLAENVAADGTLAVSFTTMAVVFSDAVPAWADFYNNRGLQIAQATDEHWVNGYAHLYSMLYHMNRAQWDEAENMAQISIRSFQSCGAVLRVYQTMSVQLTLAAFCGHFERAAELLEECRGLLSPRGMAPFARSWPCAVALDLAMACAQPADPEIDDLEQLARQAQMPRLDSMRCLGLVAQARWRRGEHEHAIRCCDEAWEKLEGTAPFGYWIGDGIAGIIEVLLAQRVQLPGGTRRHPLIARLAKAMRVMDRYSRLCSMLRPRALVLMGRWHLAEGRGKKAARVLSEAIGEASRRRMPLDEALARQALAAVGDDPQTQTARAAEIFESIGAAAFLEDLNRARV